MHHILYGKHRSTVKILFSNKIEQQLEELSYLRPQCSSLHEIVIQPAYERRQPIDKKRNLLKISQFLPQMCQVYCATLPATQSMPTDNSNTVGDCIYFFAEL